ncbi:succinylglutamate desuccinylase/aspartoacylase family protein [Oscillibacter sp. MSJ-2]|uniref:Succinylglutamate desuccinylase/aspartoacylase family protein n=1 Tax=Dysosmobacter acutus TaxID=2841504 RepID=A0ABS6F854_9FIRM|nr:succinylglutamate desuccinylase/aspartoacylase family protein [Dysosmobacter acutus]MBU5625479.1 succinylglutamate desuccinylase/aspartoacylase family protein [Dysosmobacter acutus]
MLKIGSAQAEKGKLVKGYIEMGSLADGPVRMPVMIASGEQDGEVLWLEGCIHGGEFGGALSIAQFMRELDLKALKGTIVGVPVVNILSFRNLSRNTPLDGMNINRIFPGDPDGVYTMQLAANYMELICGNANYFADFHSGGFTSHCLFYAGYKNDHSKESEVERKMCESIGSDIIWDHFDTMQEFGGIIASQVAERGIPAITCECGGGQVLDSDIAKYKGAMTGIAQVLGFLPGEAAKKSSYTHIGNCFCPVTHAGGFFMAKCKDGDILNEGDVIAEIMNLFGEIVEVIRCPENNILVECLYQKNCPISSGEGIGEFLHIYEK